jgi:hypothetical protein
VATYAEWQAEIKGMLKADMKRRNITYDQLAKKLGKIGATTASTQVLRTKVSRGGFSTVFFVQCLRAVGANIVRL